LNEAPAHEPYDFSNMPLTNEQKILAVLERIEVLLTPKQVIAPPDLIEVKKLPTTTSIRRK
jgi:hypothetical protein